MENKEPLLLQAIEKIKFPHETSIIVRPMIIRLMTAIICTCFSFMAISFSLMGYAPVLLVAWGVYFLILYFWVKHNRAPKALVIIGTIVGIIAVVFSYFSAFFFAFPAIALMLHVIKCTFFMPPRSALANQD
jgi:hypothetical protein